MPLYQRRRPTPILIIPRQVPSPTGEPESPDDTPGTTPGVLDSPDSDFGEDGIESDDSDDEEEEEPAQTGAPAPAASTGAGASASTSLVDQAPSVTSAAGAPAISSTASQAPATVGYTSQQNVASEVKSTLQATAAPSRTSIVVDSTGVPSITSAPSADVSSQTAASDFTTSTVTIPPSSAQSEITGGDGAAIGDAQPGKTNPHGGGGGGPQMSKGAEAALITFSILGALALVIGAWIFFRRRRRTRAENGMRHAEDAFNPSNTGSLHTPETVHVGVGIGGGGSHLTRSTTTSDLFGPDVYRRPETVSTDRNPSRIEKPQPTPNPFADPPLNKAFDVLRGRPRSTTLTDRGSWVQNPFRDPGSERFDPFGELQEKARMERVRYMEELRKEQDYLERERIGLGLADGQRKASGVTVEGLGVLDRSNDNRGMR